MEENRAKALAKRKGKNNITIEQRRRMEDNRVKALEKRKAKKNPPFHATKMNPSPATPKIHLGNTNADQSESAAVQLTLKQRQRMEENRVKALAKRKANARIASGRAKSIANGHGTKNYSSLASVVVSPPLSRSNVNNVPMLRNGKILILRGAQHGDATVAMDESVILVRDPHNVSLFLCQKN